MNKLFTVLAITSICSCYGSGHSDGDAIRMVSSADGSYSDDLYDMSDGPLSDMIPVNRHSSNNDDEVGENAGENNSDSSNVDNMDNDNEGNGEEDMGDEGVGNNAEEVRWGGVRWEDGIENRRVNDAWGVMVGVGIGNGGENVNAVNRRNDGNGVIGEDQHGNAGENNSDNSNVNNMDNDNESSDGENMSDEGVGSNAGGINSSSNNSDSSDQENMANENIVDNGAGVSIRTTYNHTLPLNHPLHKVTRYTVQQSEPEKPFVNHPYTICLPIETNGVSTSKVYTIFESVQDIDAINNLIYNNQLLLEEGILPENIIDFCEELCRGKFFINRIQIKDFCKYDDTTVIYSTYDSSANISDVQRNRIAITVNFLLYHILNTGSDSQNKEISCYNMEISVNNKFGCNFTYQFNEMFDVPAMYVLRMCIKNNMPISDALVCALVVDTQYLANKKNRSATIHDLTGIAVPYERAISQIQTFAEISRLRLINVNEDWNKMRGSKSNFDVCCLKFANSLIELHTCNDDSVSAVCNAINNHSKDDAEEILLYNKPNNGDKLIEQFATYINRQDVYVITETGACETRELLTNIAMYLLNGRNVNSHFPNQLRYSYYMWGWDNNYHIPNLALFQLMLDLEIATSDMKAYIMQQVDSSFPEDIQIYQNNNISSKSKFLNMLEKIKTLGESE